MAKLTMAEAQKIMADNNGNLDLRGRNDITELSEGLTVGGYLDLRGTRITELPDDLTVGSWLDLRGTPIRKLPTNLTVCGWLDLRGCENLKELPVDLTVGWYFYLNETPIIKFPIGLTVGKTIYGIENIVNKTNYKQLQNGDYVPGKYIYADDLLTLIKGVHKIGQYTVYVGKIKGRNVVSDGTYYAHCSNVRDGIADIAFKKLKDRGTAQYESLTLDSVIPFEEAVIMYRIVTGACRQGTKDFLNSQKELKKEYTVAEIIEATKGQYGHETFVRFFTKR